MRARERQWLFLYFTCLPQITRGTAPRPSIVSSAIVVAASVVVTVVVVMVMVMGPDGESGRTGAPRAVASSSVRSVLFEGEYMGGLARSPAPEPWEHG